MTIETSSYRLTLVITLLAGTLFTPVFASARAQTRTGTATKAPSESSGFELCFSSQHGRCFQTLTDDGKLRLRQFGGLSDSEAIVTNEQVIALKKEVSSFYNSTAYAKPRKVSRCTRPLVLKSPGQETRCLEKLKPKDSDKLLSLISRVSLASKP